MTCGDALNDEPAIERNGYDHRDLYARRPTRCVRTLAHPGDRARSAGDLRDWPDPRIPVAQGAARRTGAAFQRERSRHRQGTQRRPGAVQRGGVDRRRGGNRGRNYLRPETPEAMDAPEAGAGSTDGAAARQGLRAVRALWHDADHRRMELPLRRGGNRGRNYLRPETPEAMDAPEASAGSTDGTATRQGLRAVRALWHDADHRRMELSLLSHDWPTGRCGCGRKHGGTQAV
ncbi:Uncharacterised protein [Mycobacteroides abscessus subsp. abscessus]|nr:Uncharacterised protein [Mycobacteroides abscessus subsp. abscessus]